MTLVTTTLSVTEDVLTDENIRRAFIHGDCWLLAAELSWQTDYYYAVNTCGYDGDLWNHMGVMMPGSDGSTLDINGLSSGHEINERFPCNCNGVYCHQGEVIECTEDDWEHFVAMIGSQPKFCYQDYEFDGENWLVDDSHGNAHRVADIAAMVVRTFIGG